MATPLAQFANALILWRAPGTRSGGAQGYRVMPGQAYLLRAFLKRKTDPKLMELPALGGAEFALAGYVVSFAAIDDSQAGDPWQLDLSSLSFDESGQAPEGFSRASECHCFIDGMGQAEARVAVFGSDFGSAAIGAIIRGNLGDAITLAVGQVG